MLEDHLEKLKAFHITAIEGSFLRASEKLGRTQPAVTKAVKLLEDHLKSTLFVRNTRGVTLTPKGVLLNDFCEALFLKVRNLEQQMNSKEPFSGIVRIATHETLAEVLFPPALSLIGEKFPGISIELTTENIETHWLKLESGAVDIVAGLSTPQSERFYSRLLYTDHFGIFRKNDSSMSATDERVPISYVKKAFDHLGVNIEQDVSRFHRGFDLRYSVESFTTVRSLIAEGVCVGVLPFSMARKLMSDDVIVPFLAKEKFQNFGSYRVCATCVHNLKGEPKISKIMEILKLVGGAIHR